MTSSEENIILKTNVTVKKYQKQIDWRRNKVRELLIRGYSQYEISNTLHLSQPTISRDIDFIRKQDTSAEKEKALLAVTKLSISYIINMH